MMRRHAGFNCINERLKRLALWAAYGTALCVLTPATVASAQTASPAVPVSHLPEVEVLAPTPLLGSGITRAQAPSSVQVLNQHDIVSTGVPDLLGALNRQTPGVMLNDSQGNNFMPTLEYHGFVASPIDGTPQGIAVYLNGVRFNAPFSGVVNWDLIPSLAIDSTNLEGANPVFGLNALGGSLSIQMKNGFTWHGGLAELYGGSFGTIDGSVQYGIRRGDTAAYVAMNVDHSNGWRQLNASDVRQFYGDVGWRSDTAEVHLNVLLDDNVLNGPGTVPVQLLAADRTAAFTSPNRTANKFGLVSLSGTWAVSDATSLQGLLYYDNLSQRVANGNAAGVAACAGSPGILCDDDGNILSGRAGAPIPDFLSGGPYSELNDLAVDTNGFGGSAQVTHESTLSGHHNLLVAGISFDGGVATFSARTLLGGVTDQNGVFIGPGIEIDQPGGPVTPVRVGIDTYYSGAYVADVFGITRRLSLSLAGRLNLAQVDLDDEIGTALNGSHSYTHFNPGIGLTYKLRPNLSLYAGYAVGNRVPTPAELSCASPASPCTLANFFTGDPDLKQVVSHTVEAGVRGRSGRLDWNLGLFRTTDDDDILFVASSIPGLDYFQNVGRTLREGFDAGVTWHTQRLRAWINYSFTRATFGTPLTLDSPLNPAADTDGQIHVVSGDRMPGIPLHRLKFGMSYAVTKAWKIGASGLFSSGQYLFGDEANLTPETDPYFVLTANTSYQITPRVQLFGLLKNMLNAHYVTYGTFSPTSTVPIAAAPGATLTRSLSPAPPIAAYGGVRVRF